MATKPTYEELEQRVRELEAQAARSKKFNKAVVSKTWLLNALLDNLNVGVFLVEAPSGRPILANNRAIQLLGRGILNHAGKQSMAEPYQAYKLDTDEYYPENQMPIVRGLDGEYTSADDMEVVNPDGTRVILEIFGCPVVDDNGRVIASLASFADITDRHRVMDALRASEERYRSIIQNIQVAIVVHDASSQIIDSNSKAQELLGLTEDQLLGKKAFDPDWTFLDADGKKLTPEQYPVNQVLSSGKPLLDLVGIYRYDKAENVWVLVNANPVFDHHGDIFQVFVTFVDITDRRRAEEALQLAFEKYEKTFRAAPIWVVLSTIDDGRYIEVNDAFLTTMGYRREEVIGRTSLELDTWVDPRDRDHMVSRIKEKGGIRNLVLKRKTRSGEIIDLLFSAEILHLEGRQVMISVSQDISDQKKAEEESKKLSAQLQQAQKMESVGRLAGGVAHDFNNMLGVIIGHAELALQHLDPSRSIHADLIEIKSAAKRSADLTRQLLAFARRQTAAPVVLDLNETVSGMLKMLRRLIGEDIDLAWMPGANLWPVKMDPSQIDQIMANLCVNARDAIDGVGKITIETQNIVADEVYCSDHPEFTPGNYVMLAVSDDGCGLAPGTRNKLFEPFFTTKKVGKGTGLGLSTVYGIVKQNECFINVYSELEKGTTFKIFIPQTMEAEAAEDDADAGTIATGTETVLLVEDEGAVLRMGKAMLERFGYTVLATHKPDQAVAIVEQHDGPIDLLVTDVVMPEMNGKELKKKIERLTPQIKVLYMSGYTANVIMHRGILQDNVNFLQKPFSVDSLVNKVREVLDQ